MWSGTKPLDRFPSHRRIPAPILGAGFPLMQLQGMSPIGLAPMELPAGQGITSEATPSRRIRELWRLWLGIEPMSEHAQNCRPVFGDHWEVGMLHFLWMFIVGIIVGAIARPIMPGAQTMGILEPISNSL